MSIVNQKSPTAHSPHYKLFYFNAKSIVLLYCIVPEKIPNSILFNCYICPGQVFILIDFQTQREPSLCMISMYVDPGIA